MRPLQRKRTERQHGQQCVLFMGDDQTPFNSQEWRTLKGHSIRRRHQVRDCELLLAETLCHPPAHASRRANLEQAFEHLIRSLDGVLALNDAPARSRQSAVRAGITRYRRGREREGTNQHHALLAAATNSSHQYQNMSGFKRKYGKGVANTMTMVSGERAREA